MIKLPSGVEYEDIPLDKMYSSTVRGLQTRILKLYDAVVDRFGEEGYELIKEVSSEYGREIAQRVKERRSDMSLQQVALFLVRVFNGVRSQGEIIEWSEDKVTIMVPECPYPFTRPETCKAHTSMEENLVKGLNPNLDYVIEKCIPRGDEVCWHTLRRRV